MAPALYAPIRSPGSHHREKNPERIGQTTQMSRKSSTRKMRLIWLDRIVSDRSRRRTPSADRAAYAFSTNLQRVEAYPPQTGFSRRRKHCHALLTLVCLPRISVAQRKCDFGATHAIAHRGLNPAQGAISYSVKSVISA